MYQRMKKLPKTFFQILSLVMILMLAAVPMPVAAAASSQSQTQDDDLERRIIGYFCEWRDSDLFQNYTVDKIPWGKVTHINYAFAEVGSNNRIQIGDEEAAIERIYPGQDTSLPYRGHFNLLNTYKQQYPNTKTLISVGGWAGSGPFYTMLDTDAGINTFVESCIDFIREYGFNGVDIDFEYPSSTVGSGNPLDATVAEPRRSVIFNNYVKFMKALREALDEAGEEDGTHYLLSIAAPASSWILGGMQLGQYAQYLDYVNMMTYDFHGSWNGHVGPQAGLYPDPRDTETQSMVMPVLNIDWAYHYFRGVLPPEKISIGIPYYTRGWKNVSEGSLPGGLWGRAAQVGGGADGIDGIWNDPAPEQPSGTNPLYHVKNLLADPSLGYEYFWDDISKTPYIWNEAKKVFLTFEDEDSMREKCQYIIDRGIGGFIIWELSGDYDYDAITGEYVSGDTLTTLAHNMFTAAPPLTAYQGVNPAEDEKADYTFSFTGNYDHPNYTYAFSITNKTGEDIPGGFTLEFDFPKSSILQPPWGGTIASQTVKGDFIHYVLEMPSYTSIPNNATFTLQGMAKLCFSGGFQNIQINGMYSKQEFPAENDGPVGHKPVITGTEDITIEVGNEFDPMEQVIATDAEDGDLTANITVTGTVDSAAAGSYVLTYSIKDSDDNAVTTKRIVTVAEPEVMKPVISGADDTELTVGDDFDPLDGVTASDVEDGDLTDDIIVAGTVDHDTAGVYELIYSVTDSDNNTATIERIITVAKPEVVKPVISGTDDKEITVGDDFDPLDGVTASDETDGDLTGDIKVTGTVDTDTAGRYTLTYSVTNSSGQTTTENRTIIVADDEPDIPVWDSGAVYIAGDLVSYDGNTYRAKWWTQNNIPGTEEWGPWELIS